MPIVPNTQSSDDPETQQKMSYLKDVVKKLWAPSVGLPTAMLKLGKKEYTNCFAASKFILWMKTTLSVSTEDSIKTGNDLIQFGYIVPTNTKRILFEDADDLHFTLSMPSSSSSNNSQNSPQQVEENKSNTADTSSTSSSSLSTSSSSFSSSSSLDALISPRNKMGTKSKSFSSSFKKLANKINISSSSPSAIPPTKSSQNLQPFTQSTSPTNNNKTGILIPSSNSPKIRTRPDKFVLRTSQDERIQSEERMREEKSIDPAIKLDWDVNIWSVSDESNMIIRMDEETKISVVEAATLNELVKYLTSKPDMTFLKTFLTTYKSFSTPFILLKKLLQRYDTPDIPEPNSTTNNGSSDNPNSNIVYVDQATAKSVQVRVVNAIIHWLEMSPQDWNKELVDNLDILLTKMRENESPLITKIEKALFDAMEGIEKRVEAKIISSPPPPIFPKEMMQLEGIDLLLAVDKEEIARQITLLDWEIFNKIRPVELLNQAWTNPKLQYRAGNVLAFIHNFNKRANWTAENLVREDKFKKRCKIFSKFVEIASDLLRINNFSSAMAVMSGLQNAACYRLNWTKESMNNKVKTKYDELAKLLDVNKNHQNYRELLKHSVPPCLPHFAIFLTDLIFIEDGNKDIINDRLINFKKRQLLYDVISKILQFQLDSYNFQSMPYLQNYLNVDNLVLVSDDELYNMSLQVEPRGWVPE
eukprot:TRINITY_DN3004_c0_g1_i2.p1 TRINITY_DN3004_c0_g1~~TRINITY_DN3004_c0_g1_i2.p1  ORF type:complete len:700 (+),score=202.82 TRINITY_DN3004_c0_g1_i2:824-2923(+)